MIQVENKVFYENITTIEKLGLVKENEQFKIIEYNIEEDQGSSPKVIE